MAERAGDVAFINRPIQVGGLAAANDINVVLHVAVAAFEFFDDFSVAVLRGRVEIAWNNHLATFTFNDDTDGRAVIFVHRGGGGIGGVRAVHFGRVHVAGVARLRRQAAHFKNQRRSFVIVDDDLRVGRLAVILVTDASADAERVTRQSGLTEKPARDIHLVNALVADVAVAVSPEPMPFVMHRAVLFGIAPRGQYRRGAAPHIVVDGGRNRLRAGGLADAVAPFVAQPARRDDLAEISGAHPGDGFLHTFAGTDLRAGLNDAVVFLRGGGELASFPDVMRNGFPNVNIFAR